ncbi:MAG: substrate-binding domain-containing protein [Myxococcota bacterium]
MRVPPPIATLLALALLTACTAAPHPRVPAADGPSSPSRGNAAPSSSRPTSPAGAATARAVDAVSWPRFGPDREGVSLDGLTNTVPDVIGPVDGSAKLTIFTEGNHYPVLLPLVLDGFAAACAPDPACGFGADEILIVTLPQYMIVQALRAGRLRFGNLVLPLAPGGVWPNLVMGGRGPLTKLAADGLVVAEARVLARHRGMGLLARQTHGAASRDLASLSASSARIVMATPIEKGARRQYRATLVAALGQRRTDALFDRAVGDFPGRLAIQHRDVPYALLSGRADVGVIFGHLATFYARRYPDTLVATTLPASAAFGETILMAPTRTRTRAPDPALEALIAYLRRRAPAAYEAGGFAAPGDFDFDATVRLDP